MKDKNRNRLRTALNEGAGTADIMNLVEDIVRDERIDARKKGRTEGHEAGFTTGWDSAHAAYM